MSPSTDELLLPAGPDKAARTLRRWIDSGTLAAGRRLPSERVLAERLRVGRGTLRQALLHLERDGIVRAHPRRGRVVMGTPATLAASTSLLSGTVIILAGAVDPSATVRHDLPGWHHQIELGVVDAVRSAGRGAMSVAIGTLNEPMYHRLIGERPAGVIAIRDAGARLPSAAELMRFRDAGLPVAVYGSAPDLAPFDRLTSDHEAGAYELARYLIGLGRRRILRYHGMTKDSAELAANIAARDAGVERACREAGLEIIPPIRLEGEWVSSRSKHWFEVAVRTSAGFLIEHMHRPDPVDAILSISDGLVPSLIGGCRLLNRRVHEDVALVGYDNFWSQTAEAALERTPPLATIDKHNFECGRRLQRLLEDRIAGRLPEAPQRIVVRPELVTPVS